MSVVAREAERLIALIDRFRGRRVAVVGDLVADEFFYGEQILWPFGKFQLLRRADHVRSSP